MLFFFLNLFLKQTVLQIRSNKKKTNMKKALVLGLLIAVLIAVITVFHFVQPVLILTIGDIMWMIILDVIIAFLLALYLGYDKGENRVILWTIIGSACLPISIIASMIKYNKKKTS